MPITIIDHDKEFHIMIEHCHYYKRNVEAVKALPVRRWHNGEKKYWHVPGDLRMLVMELKRTHRAQVIVAAGALPEQLGEISPLPDLTITLPWKEGVKTRPYQDKGVARGMELKQVLIGDEQGLGKTLQSIGVMIGLNAFPCLVVCPSSTKINWQREWQKFSGKRAMVLDSSMKPALKKNWPQYVLKGLVDVVIVNYESVAISLVDSYPTKGPWMSKDVTLKPFVSMFRSGILDESHRCKNDLINTSKFILKIFSGLKERILLSGTSVVNGPKDLYPQLAILGKLHLFGGKKGFLERYCEGGKGANNMRELNFLLNKYCYFRREKKEVAKDLPEKSRQTIICDITTRAEYERAKTDFVRYLQSIGKDDTQIMKSLAGEVMVKMGELKKISARGKLNEVREFVTEVMESGQKLVLFCNLYEIVEALLAEFPRAVTITGRDDMDKRQRNIDAFQNDPKVQLIVCNIKAAGVGVTLTASSRVAFIEYPWTYADCAQCEDRVHRIGQVWPVTCTYFLGENTIDEYMYFDIIQGKREVANTITGNTDKMEMTMVEKAFNLFKI